jgi:hypothetical protein
MNTIVVDDILPKTFDNTNEQFNECNNYKIPFVTIHKKNKKKYCKVELDCITALPYHTFKENISDDFYFNKYHSLMAQYPINEKMLHYQGGYSTVYFHTEIQYSDELALYLFHYGNEFIRKNRILSLEKILVRFRNFIRNEYLKDDIIFEKDMKMIAFWKSGIPERFMIKHFDELKDYLNDSIFDTPLELFQSSLTYLNCSRENEIDVLSY